jgi:hypothetical protein
MTNGEGSDSEANTYRESVKRDVGVAINCTTQYVQNLNHMFKTKTNGRRVDGIRSSSSETSDLPVKKSVKYRLRGHR